jgi:hypothetical protein
MEPKRRRYRLTILPVPGVATFHDSVASRAGPEDAASKPEGAYGAANASSKAVPEVLAHSCGRVRRQLSLRVRRFTERSLPGRLGADRTRCQRPVPRYCRAVRQQRRCVSGAIRLLRPERKQEVPADQRVELRQPLVCESWRAQSVRVSSVDRYSATRFGQHTDIDSGRRLGGPLDPETQRGRL